MSLNSEYYLRLYRRSSIIKQDNIIVSLASDSKVDVLRSLIMNCRARISAKALSIAKKKSGETYALLRRSLRLCSNDDIIQACTDPKCISNIKYLIRNYKGVNLYKILSYSIMFSRYELADYLVNNTLVTLDGNTFYDSILYNNYDLIELHLKNNIPPTLEILRLCLTKKRNKLSLIIIEKMKREDIDLLLEALECSSIKGVIRYIVSSGAPITDNAVKYAIKNDDVYTISTIIDNDYTFGNEHIKMIKSNKDSKIYCALNKIGQLDDILSDIDQIIDEHKDDTLFEFIDVC